jgi:DNA polymerase-1
MKTILDYPIKIIQSLPPKATKKDRCAIDTEFFDMDIQRGHRPVKLDGSPNGVFACATFCLDGKTVYVVTDENEVQEALDNVKDSVWIFANAKFDITHLRRYATVPVRTTKLWDVIAIEQIMYSGYYSDFGLKHLARRRLNTYLPKDAREQFEDAKELNEETLQYAAYDPLATWHVYQSQRKEIFKNDKNTLKLWKDIDIPAIWAVMSMSGFKLDVEKWTELAEEAVAKREALQTEKYPLINLNSSPQVSKELRKQGYKLPKTEKGNYQANIDVLTNLKEPNEFINDLIAYSGTKTLATTYGMNFIKRGVEIDGKVYANFKPLGAATGRFSSSAPNLQNIPNEKKDPRYRECFIAAEDNILIIGDWSSQEPRIYAYLTQDEKLIDIFNNDLDIYIESARLMYGWELTKKDPRRKSPMKPTVLGACYGLTEYGMEEKYGIPKKEGRQHLSTFFETFTQAADWNNAQREKTDYVETIAGRKFWLNIHSSKSRNNSLNSPVQGSASDAMKQAAWCFCEKWGAREQSPIENLVHDEIVLEVHESAKDSAIQCLRECMIEVGEATHPGIKADCNIGWGKTWGAKV